MHLHHSQCFHCVKTDSVHKTRFQREITRFSASNVVFAETFAYVTTPYELFFCEKESTLAKKPFFCVFLVFFLVSSTCAQSDQENFAKSVVKSSYKARESWYTARKAVF